MELYYLITISDRDRAEMLSAIYHAAGTGMVLTKLGRGTATGEQLSSYGLDATEKAVVSTVADAEQTRQIFRAAKRKLFIDIPGNGVMMAIPLKSVAGGRTLGFLTDSTQTGGKPAMDFSHELIMAIMNEGYSDTVMDAARSAGAGGGTVLHAKGTGRARAEKFFGVSLADGKGRGLYCRPRGGKGGDHAGDCRQRRTWHQSGRDLLLAADFAGGRLARTRRINQPPGRRASGGFAIGLIERAFR